jgi:hypothetical protein
MDQDLRQQLAGAPPAPGATTAPAWRFRRRGRLACGRRASRPPLTDHRFLVDQRHEDRRPERKAPPAKDLLVEFGDPVTYLLLGAQLSHGLRT